MKATPGISVESWNDYELIDSGGLEKLERFGKYILARPEPQAVWSKALPEEEWKRLANAWYHRAKGADPGKSDNTEKGEWIKGRNMPEQWLVRYDHGDLKLTMRLGLTSFGHVGIFPEHAENWRYIFDILKRNNLPSPRVLNLFAYTGAASLAARAAGAGVYHIDSVKPVVTWARENMKASGLQDIHWVVEDALKFVRREVRRGNRYSGIILDPPAYGRGPEGEKWVLQDLINELVMLCSNLLDDGGFFIMSLYSMGFSAMISESLVKTHFRQIKNEESGELFFTDRSGRKLPLGTIFRFEKQV